jgi:two-component system, OmpR family, response regulator VicR
MNAHLLYVEDDESLGFVTRDNLEMKGYRITHCNNGREALDLIRHTTFDLCILDVMLPEVDGYDIAREIRRLDQQTPIIFLTAKSLKEDRIHGLRLGADDYITKPFSIEELILKIEVFLRRSKAVAPTAPDDYRIGEYRFNPANLTLERNGDTKRLTQRESDLLLMLIQQRGQVVKRSVILEKLWGQDDYFLGRSLDVFISRLRRYLGADPGIKLETVHGVGFQLSTGE